MLIASWYYAKFVAGAGLPLGDAFDLGCVQRVDLVPVLRLLGAHLLGKSQRLGEGGGDIGAREKRVTI